MSSIVRDFASIVGGIRRPGDFFAFGTLELLAPRLEVEGVGRIALPLLRYQANQLVAVAERAPYGRGAETLVDTAIRRTWQIDAARVRIEGGHWQRTLDAVVGRAAEGLGVSDPVGAELYKLLVYDQGSFFVSHRDTEKVPGMFATLVLVLPSDSTGGELLLKHKGREARLDLGCHDPSELAFAAFYADCVHEVLPVTSGFRLALVYNLLRRGRGRVPAPPDYAAEQSRLAAVLKAWTRAGTSLDADVPVKLVYPLEHAYTQAELGFGALKGADAAAAPVVVAATRDAGCDVHLALVTIEESGSAVAGGYYGGEEEFEETEVDDRVVTASDWRRPDGCASPLAAIPVEEDEVSPPGAFDELEPDEEQFHEATGNEGASFERTYRRAAFVLWPGEQVFAVLNRAGLTVTLPYLRDLTERWEAGGRAATSPLRHQAHELAGRMLASWPAETWTEDRDPSEQAEMLMLLTRLGDKELLEACLAGIAARGKFDKRDSPAILAGLALLAPDRAASSIARVVAGGVASSLGACADLLARAAAGPPHSLPGLIDAAMALVNALPGDPARAAKPAPAWSRRIDMTPRIVVDLLTALADAPGDLAETAQDYILAWPKTYGLDSVLVPAAAELLESRATGRLAAVRRLREACVRHLRRRIAEPLEPPRDWSRDSKLGCKCANCTALGRYLADPANRTWMLKASQAERNHVEESIRRGRCDVDTRTERRGRPYTLVCTKNQASHDRRVEERKKDLANLARLGG